MWLRAACGCLLLLFLHSTTGWCSGSAAYLYVNSNTGAAAGGHIALRIDDEVYHYQFFPDKRFLLVRESWSHFRLVYNRLRNRAIVSAQLPPESAGRIGSALNYTLMAQQLILDREQKIRDHLALLETLGGGEDRITVPGLGFFNRQQSNTSTGMRIRAGVQELLGEDGLVRSRKEIEQGITGTYRELSNWRGDGEELANRLEELTGLAARQAALDIMIAGYGLADEALVGAAGMIELSDEQVEGFGIMLEHSMKSLARLIQSTHPTSGRALLLQLARCHALNHAIENRQLLTLDPFPDGGRVRQVDLTDGETRDYLTELARLLQVNTASLIDLVANSGLSGGVRYTVLENYNGRLNEILKPLTGAGPVRLAPEFMVPSRSAEASIPPYRIPPFLSEHGPPLLTGQLRSVEETIGLTYGYNLIAKNCVNELLRTVNSAFSSPAESEQLLGGWIEPVADKVVIPHDFFHKVNIRYRIDSVQHYPSRRITALSRVQGEGGLDIWLREGNTISSTLYQPRIEDTPFLFFTDDRSWTRPLLGFANLTWATLHAAGGLITLPEDGGERFIQGGRGMFYSLPELIFCNIRKGTYAYENFSERMHDL